MEQNDLMSVAVCPDGGYILAGYTESQGAGGFNGWVVKLDPSGNVQWNKTLGGIGIFHSFHSVAVSSDGGYILAGAIGKENTILTLDKYDYEGWVVKLDSAGNEQYNHVFEGFKKDEFLSVAACSDECYILAGYNESQGAGGEDGWVVKLAPTTSVTTTPAPGLFIAIMCGLVAFALARRR